LDKKLPALALNALDLDEFLNDIDLDMSDGPDNPDYDPNAGSLHVNFPPSVLEIGTTTPEQPPSTISGPSSSVPTPSSATVVDMLDGQQRKVVEANSCCDLCGYRPKGDPQWFKGSMAKHKKKMHSDEPPEIYKCPFPGCNSQYKRRPDNLRQHQIEKNHWAPGEEMMPRRPGKRKKLVDDED